jgi:hypothetical protein
VQLEQITATTTIATTTGSKEEQQEEKQIADKLSKIINKK